MVSSETKLPTGCSWKNFKSKLGYIGQHINAALKPNHLPLFFNISFLSSAVVSQLTTERSQHIGLYFPKCHGLLMLFSYGIEYVK